MRLVIVGLLAALLVVVPYAADPGVAQTDGDAPLLDNVAVDGLASQSSTAFGGVAARAIDGNTSGVYNQGSVTHTAGNDGLPWWEVELAADTDIHSVTLWNRTNCCAQRLSDFSVFVSDAPFVSDATIAELQADPAVWSYDFDGAVDVSVDIPVDVSGRYVRIQKLAGSALSLAEVQVFEVADIGGSAPIQPSDLLVSSGAPGQPVQLSWDPLGLDPDAVSFAIFADGQLVEEVAAPIRFWNSTATLAGTELWSVAARAESGALSTQTQLLVEDATTLLSNGESEGCRSIALEDGQTIIRVDDAGDGWSQALYENDFGEFVPFQWLADHPELEGVRSEVDSVTSHAGSLNGNYRVVSYSAESDMVRTYPCNSEEFDSVYDELVEDGFPVLESGVIGANMSDAGLPTRIIVPDPLVPADQGGPSVQEAIPSCGAGGIFMSAVPPEAQQESWISIDVPEGVAVTVDVISRRLAVENGSWIVEFDVFATNPDGSMGAEIDGLAENTPFWWANPFLDLPEIGEDRYQLDDSLLFTAPETGTYLIRGVINSLQVDEDDLSQPSTRLEDIKFWDSSDPDTRQLIAEPCANSQHYDCQVAGGNAFVENEVVLDDGTVLSPGCYEWDHCATPTVGWGFDSISVWACEHQTGLQQALMIGAVLAVGGLMIIGGSAAGSPGAGIGAATGLATSLWSCNENEYSLLAESFDDLNGSCVATEVGLGAVFGAVAGPAGATTSFPRLLGVACTFGAAEGATAAVAHGYVQEDQTVNAVDTLVGGVAGCVTAGVITTGSRAISSLLPGTPRTTDLPDGDSLANLQAQYPTRADRIAFLEANGSTVRKANYGEMAADQAMLDLQLDEFVILHSPRVSSIDSPITQGIDHIFRYRDSAGQIRYVIAETKYSVDGTVSTTASALTQDGRQMSDDWLRGSNRLQEAGLGDEVIDEVLEAIDANSIERVLVSVGIGGTVSFREIDSQGIAGAVWSAS